MRGLALEIARYSPEQIGEAQEHQEEARLLLAEAEPLLAHLMQIPSI